MELTADESIHAEPDLRHRVRSLSWFKTSFARHAGLLSREYGLSITVDEVGLSRAFLNWAEHFERDRTQAQVNRRDFMVYSAGQMLRELIVCGAATASRSRPLDAAGAIDVDADRIIASWPTGFFMTHYCMSVLSAALEQEGSPLAVAEIASDLRTWWSFRENVEEDPSLAIAFVDLFAGVEPNWRMPDAIHARAAMQRAVPRTLGAPPI